MKKRLMNLAILLVVALGANAQSGLVDNELAVRNLTRAIELSDNIFDKMYRPRAGYLSFYYNVETKIRRDVVSVWEYTAAFETVNSILEGLEKLKDAEPELYESAHDRYVERLETLYNGLAFYQGEYTEDNPLISYTGPNAWKPVHGVHRASTKGNANIQGVENVYDDQMWIIRELLRAYKVTGTAEYLATAEALTAYVLDGWDCNLDANGNEYGGITWGPGYTSKHACSNSPLIQPLVWLSEIYGEEGNTEAEVSYYVLDQDGKRQSVTKKKQEYYLDFAEKIFNWQYAKLRDLTTGVYWDAAWASTGDITYREIDGVKYRVHLDVGNPGGDKWTYNTGTMISGAAELYRVTENSNYLTKLNIMMPKAHAAFVGRKTKVGDVYLSKMIMSKNSSTGCNGSPWFNQVLERGFIDAVDYFDNAKVYVEEEQNCLDYAYDNNMKEGFMSKDLIDGWGDEKEISVQYALARASEYALIVRYTSDDTGIDDVNIKKNNDNVSVYTVDGREVRGSIARKNAVEGLAHGIYIVDGEKIAVR